MDDLWRDRLVARMEALGFTKASLSVAAGRGITFVRDLLAGTTPSIENLQSVCEVLGVTVSYIMTGEVPVFQSINVIGKSSFGEGWDALHNSEKPDDVPMRTDGGEAIAIEVQGDSMRPFYRDRDVLIGAKSIGKHVDNLLGLDCIVMTEDGRRFIKALHRGSVRGTYTLRSLAHGKPDVDNVKLLWAAPITWIRRAL